MMVLFWISLIFAVVWMLKQQLGGGPRPATGPEGGGDALGIARRAYAKGDRPRERYMEIIEDLRHNALTRH